MSDLSQYIERAFHSYKYYFQTIWGIVSEEKLVWNWHLSYICDELQELSKYIIAREPAPYDIIINIPPGMTKSTIVSQAWIGWLWLHDPSISIISSSYSYGLSSDNSLKAKTIINSGIYQLYNDAVALIHGERIKLVKYTETYWMNNFTGFYYATSTGGTVTGKHANILCRDDPLKPMDAKSEKRLHEVNEYNDKTLSTRKKDKEGTPTVTVMQRLHDNDPSGHDLKKNLSIKHICLPATASDNVRPKELKKKYKNGVLDVNRLPQRVIEKEKVRLGSVGFANQYDQITAPLEGIKVKKEWFKTCNYSDIPNNLTTDMFIDGAYTKTAENDPTGILITRFDQSKGRLYVLSFENEYMEMPELIKRVVHLSDERLSQKGKILIEPKASGLSLKQMLNEYSNVNPVNIKSHLVSEGKTARADTAAPRVEAGKVILLDGSWIEEFISQIAYFPNWQHDEAVDLLGYACDYYFRKKSQHRSKGIKQKN